LPLYNYHHHCSMEGLF